jgi:hypothetical protein
LLELLGHQGSDALDVAHGVVFARETNGLDTVLIKVISERMQKRTLNAIASTHGLAPRVAALPFLEVVRRWHRP